MGEESGAGDDSLRLVRSFAPSNLFCRGAALRLAVALPAALRPLPPGAAERLRAALAACRPAEGGLDELAVAAAEGPLAAALIGEIAVRLQRWRGHAVSFFAAPPARDPAWDAVVIECATPECGLAAGQAAAAAVLALAGAPDALPQRLRAALAPFLEGHPALPEVVAAAAARGIPWRQPIPGQPIYDLGQGRRLRRIWRHFTPATSHVASVVATNKQLASALFRAGGIPAPHNRPAADPEEAVRAAHALGLPVVVKPTATDHGTAVAVRLASEAAVRQAFAAARRHGPVLVEEFIPGRNHRLLVMYGRFVSAVRQTPAEVTGDGRSTIRALVEAVNRTRSTDLSARWKKIKLDAEAERVLADQGLRPDDVAPAGAAVRLRTQSNLSEGGTMENVTLLVHPDNRDLAVRAAALVGLDVAGIDFITSDVTRSWREVGGAICEINPTPGFVMGEPPGVIEGCFLDGLFPAGTDGRLPAILLLDDDPARPLLAPLEALLAAAAPAVGMAATGEARIAGAPYPAGHPHPAAGAALLLGDPGVGSLLLALTGAEALEGGIGLDRCSVAAIARGGAEPRRIAALRLVAGTAATVVAAADDPAVPALRALSPPPALQLVESEAGFIAAARRALDPGGAPAGQ
jgi:cyanophycin synthetase